MTVSDQDPDVVRWQLDQLFLPSNGDCGQVGCVRERCQEPVSVNVENDAVIARAYQEELSRLAAAEASGNINPGQAYIVSQDWLEPPGRRQNFGYEYDDRTAMEDPNQNEIYTNDHRQMTHEFSSVINEQAGEDSTKGGDPFFEEDVFHVIDITDDESSVLDGEVGKGLSRMVPAPVGTTLGNLTDDESSVLDGEVGEGLNQMVPVPVSTTPGNLMHDESSVLDGEVGKRLNQMVPVPHVPKTNGDIPSADEEISDHERLLERLNLYDLVENKVQGDGNCQFRALSDQLYRSPDLHKFVREQVVSQLKSYPEMYKGYVPMAYGDYLKKMSKNGEWGDHVTLQAAADLYGVRIFVITSFKDTCYIEILPHVKKSNRVICLSFWAEVHYNSIYPEGGKHLNTCYRPLHSTVLPAKPPISFCMFQR